MNRMFVKCTMPYKQFETKEENGNLVFSIVSDIIAVRRERINKAIVKECFEIYKDSKYSEVYLISETEFEHFLKWALPKYMEAKGKKK